MAKLPTGTVTFLFTDIEGSTRLLGAAGDSYAALLDRHHALLRDSFASHGGVEVMTEGDAFFLVFRSPTGAVHGAADAQRALHAETWPEGAEVRVRIGLHTGEAVLGGDNYVGLDVHRASRIASAAHGGQVLISDATRALVEQVLPDGVGLRDLGVHRLRDLPHTERLFQVVIDGLPSTFPAIRSLTGRPNNLPAPVTSFIGRERQIAEIKERLASTRLLTLTGAGGTGKTRLSIRVAEELLTEYEDGCWFVALDVLRDSELVPSAIAAALGVQVAGDRPVMSALESWLADRQLLLVLDNFEQVADAAPVVGQLLAGAPRMRVLATSRTPLHLYGETEHPVPPLAVVTELRAAAGSAEALGQYEAVRLFIERALAVKPDFQVTNANAPAVAEICVRLDGLPLAIELAAARVKVLSPEQIVARLERNLSLLASAARDLPERQRTLQGAIDWSFNLLSQPEQQLFARLAAFRGGFSLESAEGVCGGDDRVPDIFEGLASLVDKSLLRATESDAETRFTMLETIRHYAVERLAAAGDAEAIRSRHAEHFFALAVESEPHLTGSEQVVWLDRLETEHDNLRAAFDRAAALGLIDRAHVAAGSIWRFWQQRGHFAEARMTFDRLLALPGTEPAARAKALSGAGGIAYWQNDFEATGRFYHEARELYESVGDRAGTAQALYNEAYVPLLGGDFEAARQLFARACELYREEGDELALAEAESMVGFIHFFQGDAAQAIPSLEKAIEIYRRADARFLLADNLIGLAFVRAMAGEWREAVEHVRESLALFNEAGNEVGLSMVLEAIGASAAWVGDSERGVRLLGVADALRQRLGAGPPNMFLSTEVHRAKARERLGDERYDQLHSAGAQLSSTEATELAEGFDPPADAEPAPPPQPWGEAAASSAAEAGTG